MKRLRPQLLAAAIYAAIIALLFLPWLRPFQLPQRGGPDQNFRAGDLTPLFAVWNEVTLRAILDQHEFPLWSDHIYCGEPFFAKPQVSVLSLTTALGLLLHFTTGWDAIESAQAISTWTFLIHLWIAALAAYALAATCLQIAAPSEPAAGGNWVYRFVCPFLAGLCFMLSGLMIEHAMMGHAPIVLVACWTPLVMRSLILALTSGSYWGHAAGAGLLLAVQLLAGGSTVFLYTSIAVVTVSAIWFLAESSRSWMRRLLRLAVVGGVVGSLGAGLAAVKILPGMELMPLCNRAGGLSAEVAAGRIVEFREPWVAQWLAGDHTPLQWDGLFAVTLSLAACGAVVGLVRPRRRWWGLAALVLVILGFMLARSPRVFQVAWEWVPVFRYQRIPQRALLLSYVGLSMLAALGLHTLAGLKVWPGIFRDTLLVSAVAMVAWEHWAALPSLPPSADIRREIRQNHIMNHLAGLPGKFRVHCFESWDRNWGVEHVTVPLGLENLVGWDHLWLLEYLGSEGRMGWDIVPFLDASYGALRGRPQLGIPARFWGLMNVKYVTATRGIEVPGLRFVRKFEPCAICQPARSAGPYLYENTAVMPRVWVVPAAVLIVGSHADRLLACYHVMAHDAFDPHRVAVLLAGPDEAAAVLEDAPGIAAVLWARGEHSNELLEELGQRGLKQISYETLSLPGERVATEVIWEDPGLLRDLLANAPAVVSQTPELPEYSGNNRTIQPGGQTGFLVLAEKFAHFPGWSVQTSAGSRPLLRANAVASASPLDGSEELVQLRYSPASFLLGLRISAATLATVLALGFGTLARHWRLRKLRSRTSDASA